MPLSKEADAARKREERGAEARAQEKVALQSEVTPEAKRSKRSNERSKRIAEASVLALPLEEEEIVLPEEQKQAKLLRAKERIINFKVDFHDYLRKKSCAIQRQPQQPFDNSTEESSLVSGLAAVHRFYEDRNMFRATCVCCSELYAPVCVRTVPIEQGGIWLR